MSNEAEAQDWFREKEALEWFEKLRAATKWIFDLFRNVVILGLLWSFQERSNSPALVVMTGIGWLALLFYVQTYMVQLCYKVRVFKSQRLNFAVAVLIGLPLVGFGLGTAGPGNGKGG